MLNSKRISTIADYCRTSQATSKEILDLLDIVVDEFAASETKEAKQRGRIRVNLANISKYLANQAY